MAFLVSLWCLIGFLMFLASQSETPPEAHALLLGVFLTLGPLVVIWAVWMAWQDYQSDEE